jgi:hypothetical protein
LLDIHIILKTASAPPVLVSIIPSIILPINATNVDFTVTFSEFVEGVDKTDFFLETTGVSGAAIASVNGSGSIFTVTVETGTGTGTIRLGLIDDDSIVDSALTPLGGKGAGNGSYTSNEVYDVHFYQILLPVIFTS